MRNLETSIVSKLQSTTSVCPQSVDQLSLKLNDVGRRLEELMQREEERDWELELLKNASRAEKIILENKLQTTEKRVDEKVKELEVGANQLKEKSEAEKQVLEKSLEEADLKVKEALQRNRYLEGQIKIKEQERMHLEDTLGVCESKKDACQIELRKTKMTRLARENCHKARGTDLKILTNDKRYFIRTKATSWAEAKVFCESRGMWMASAKNKADLAALLQETDQFENFDRWWLSASDIGQRPGEFRWIDGSPIDKNLWDKQSGEPDDHGEDKQTCVLIISGENKRLYDDPCTLEHNIICELPAECY
ncbi:C-type lectin domain family 4 member F-like isoform X2 [Neocloeon triangulifer]|nr:C-type lectin domain family 4 member F-like isoform X2 [Neocloeon triangulifer]